MKLVILGAGAGGGLPQWNCGCTNCSDARDGKLPAMTQSSVAVSADGARWVVLNASPDIAAQLQRTKALWPKSLRGTPIAAVFLTNGDIDHIAGLLTLREKTPFTVFATTSGMDILATNSVFNVLDATLVERSLALVDEVYEPVQGVKVTPFSVPGKVALFLENEDALDLEAVGDQTIGLLLEANGKRAAYVPGCAALPDWLLERLDAVDLLLFDGTVWENDDMAKTGTGSKTGARMGHLPLSGSTGSIERLETNPARKVFVHINNTNPILQPASKERAQVERAGWEIAYDGMEIEL